MKVKQFVLCTLIAGLGITLSAQESPDPYANETKEQRDERMAWWREAKFGMFIHWGVYAVPAGTYKGEQIPKIGEWIMHTARIPVSEYKAFAKEFNPVKYDPDAWAKLAKEAGMKYIVITSKHHDGFALYDSKVTDWDIVDATPYGKDLLKPLVKAAKKNGLKMGFYYSQAQDWNHPGGAKMRYKVGDGWDNAHKGNFDKYIDDIAVPQTEEILSNYDLDVLWWDTPTWMNKERAEKLIPLLKLRPGIIHNNRLGGGYKGDTETPEQHIPATGFKNRDWEVCMTMNDTWGYKSYDDNWKSTEDLIHKLCDIVSKGGNFLLNVGPTAEGEIPQPSIDRLKEVGKWMDVNGESIYGTTANPFSRLPWGRCTKRMRDNGTTLYLHVFNWPEDGKLLLWGLKNMPESVQLLDGKKELSAGKMDGDAGIVINVPSEAPDSYASVIKLDIKGDLMLEEVMSVQGKDGSVEFAVGLADLHNHGYSKHIQLENKGDKPNIGYWVNPRAWIGWKFKINKPGMFLVRAETASVSKSNLSWGLKGADGNKSSVEPTGDYASFEKRDLGQLTIKKAGTYELELRAVRKDWNPVNIRNVTLTPVKK